MGCIYISRPAKCHLQTSQTHVCLSKWVIIAFTWPSSTRGKQFAPRPHYNILIISNTLTILRSTLVSMAKLFRLSYHGPHAPVSFIQRLTQARIICFWSSSDICQLSFHVQELPWFCAPFKIVNKISKSWNWSFQWVWIISRIHLNCKN